MLPPLLPVDRLPADYEWIRWQETNYQSTRGGLGPLRVTLYLPPAGQVRACFVSTLDRRLLPVIDAYGRMLPAPEHETDAWSLSSRLKFALRDHITWQRLRIERGVFVATADYPALRFELSAAIAPPEAAPSPAVEDAPAADVAAADAAPTAEPT